LGSLANAYAATARQAGAQISTNVEPGLCAVLHREMIHRFFDNLVLNALDFVRPGGRIEVAAAQEGAELLLAVRNTGEPVPAEARARLFQKGVVRRGSRQRNNLGLGLYLCRLVAVAHDGSVALREETGWATSFVARLTVEAERTHPCRAAAEEAGGCPRRKAQKRAADPRGSAARRSRPWGVRRYEQPIEFPQLRHL